MAKRAGKKSRRVRVFKKSATHTGNKKGARKKVKASKRAKKSKFDKEPGYTRRRGSGLLVPDFGEPTEKVFPLSKLEKGIADAKDKIKDMLYSVAQTFGDGFEVRHVDLQASFSADGKFLGIGVGSAAMVTIRVALADESEE
jgi:hypothetical protein